MSKIQWTGETWNPVRGCSRVSAGCENCYAMKMAHRFSNPGGPYEGLTRMTSHGIDWTGKVRFVPEKLSDPLRWRKPRRVFVNSMSDLFHDGVSAAQIAAVFGVMAACPQHVFQILTKRPARMVEWFKWADRDQMPGGVMHSGIGPHLCAALGIPDTPQPNEAFAKADEIAERILDAPWPLPNVHIGVSVEDRAAAESRLLLLRNIPAAVRWMSAEPLLGDLGNILGWLSPTRGYPSGHAHKPPGLDWLVVGGESGPGARPCDVAWIRSLVRQCRDADVACFVKQLGANVVADSGSPDGPAWCHTKDRKGGDPAEWPDDLRVRNYPQ